MWILCLQGTFELIFLSLVSKMKHIHQKEKKTNLVPVHKRNDKQLLKNYQPISGEVFERLINNITFQFFINNH